MSTDTTSAIAVSFGRQDGVTVRPFHSTPTAAAGRPVGPALTSVVGGAGNTQATGQDLPVREQELPPGEKAGNAERLQQAISEMNSFLQNLQRDLKFEVDSELGRTVISVVDSETKEVIRQIPSEEVLERAKRLEQSGGTVTGTDGLLLKVQA